MKKICLLYRDKPEFIVIRSGLIDNFSCIMSIVVSNDSSDILMCPVCYEPPEIYSVGQCDHPICHCCATRMRVLCEQMYCAICRGDLAQVSWLKYGIMCFFFMLVSDWYNVFSIVCVF